MTGTTVITRAGSKRLRGVLALAFAGTALTALATQSAFAQTAPAPTPATADEPSTVATDIIVTGTRIRGIAPVGAAVIQLNQEAIKATGLASVTDIVRTVPQIANIGSDEGRTGSTANSANANITYASGINLRGIGSQATLTLIDGHRPAPQGILANFFDPSNLPVIAISNVEVLADGASALYGSDAISGVVNLGLRKDFSGVEATARYTLGRKYNAQRYSAIAGFGWGSGHIMVAGEYNENSSLSAGNRADLFIGADQPVTQLAGNGAVPTGFVNQSPIPNIRVINPATNAATGSFYAVNAAGTGVTANAQNIISRWAGSNVLPKQERVSFVGAFHQDITDWLTVYAQGHFTRRTFSDIGTRGTTSGVSTNLTVPATNFYAAQLLAAAGGTLPASARYSVSYSFLNSLGLNAYQGYERNWDIVGGVTIALPHDWKADLSASYGRNYELRNNLNQTNTAQLNAALASTNAATAFNPFGATPTTVLNAIRAQTIFRSGYDLTVLSAKVDGGLFSLPGGDVKLAVGGEYAYNKEYTDNLRNTGGADNTIFIPQQSGRTEKVSSVYGEIVVPVFGASNATAGLQKLDVSAAVRYDYFNVLSGSTVNPKFGITWKPTNDLTVRASYGTSFRYNLIAADTNAAAQITANSGGYADYLGLARTSINRVGGNAGVGPENAKTWTLGAEYKPTFAHGVDLTLTYFNINYSGVIDSPGNAVATGISSAAVAALYTPYITRRPSSVTPGADDTAFNALVASLLTSPLFQFAPPAGGAAAVNIITDARNQNAGTILTQGLDFTAYYKFEFGPTRWNVGVSGTKYFEYKRSISPTQSPFDSLGLIDYPTDYRLRGQVSFAISGLQTNLFINYLPSYTNTYDATGGIVTAIGNGTKIASQTTLDFSASLDVGKMSGNAALKDLVLGIDIQNLTDARPAYALVGSPIVQTFDSSTGSALGRTASFRISKKF